MDNTEQERGKEDEEEEDHLASLSLEELQELPQQLEEKQNEINNRIRSLALQHYPVHIDSFEAIEQVAYTAQTGQDTCHDALEKAAKASTLCRGDSLSQLYRRVKAFKSVKSTMEQYSRLSDLLKIPQYFELCVRNNMQDDAVELLNSFSNIIHRHSQSIIFPIGKQHSQSTTKGSDAQEEQKREETQLGLRTRCLPALLGLLYSTMLDSADALERMTLKQFETDLAIPQILDAARLLKKLLHTKKTMRECLYTPVTDKTKQSEVQEKIQEIINAVLQARSRWITGKVNLNLPSSPFEQLSQMMDVLSTKIPDVQRQLRAFISVFGQDQEYLGQQSTIEWTKNIMTEFIHEMEGSIKLITDPDELVSLMEQSGFAGDKTSHCGYHPTILILNRLVQHALDLMNGELAEVTEKFGQRLRHWLDTKQEPSSNNNEGRHQSHIKSLTKVYPMAVLWDDIVDIWEKYKKCFPTPLLPEVTDVMGRLSKAVLVRLYAVSCRYTNSSSKLDITFETFEQHFLPLLSSTFNANSLADSVVQNASWLEQQ